MLVEDNGTDVFLVQEAIKAHHLPVRLLLFTDGEAAIEFVERVDGDSAIAPPRLFLLDLNLPRRSGSEVLARIRQSPKCGRVPVVIVTSSDLEKERTLIAELGATDYFRKPAGYDAFLAIGKVIQRLLAA